jgi:hypothetical protein
LHVSVFFLSLFSLSWPFFSFPLFLFLFIYCFLYSSLAD